MATIEDFDVAPGGLASVETVARLMSAPSDEWLQSFGANFQELDTTRSPSVLSPTLVGKFIAIHDLVLLAPFPEKLFHRTMLEAARLNDADLLEEKQAEMWALGTGLPGKDLRGQDADQISDGGYFTLKSTGGVITDIILDQDSGQFGRADEAGREKTAEYTQLSLHQITASVFKQLTLEEFMAQHEEK